MDAQRHRWRSGDAALAAGVAALLGVGWAWRDWASLSVLHLPDTDDAVRLQQIRDWLAGQAFADVSQHRLAGGLAMHWSRLPDLVPGGIIAGLTPLLGSHAAELAAVILWPALLFAATLFLVASITRAIMPAAAPTALVVAAIGYPVTTLFVPGRIDHHGLQIVLLLLVVRALLARSGGVRGVVAGVAAAASLVVGMEMAPFLALAAAWHWQHWVLRGRGADAALTSFGAGLIVAMLVARPTLASRQFDFAGCDGFTQRVWMLAIAGGGAAVALGLGGRWLRTPIARLITTGVIGGLLAFAFRSAIAGCLHPYGAVDPLVAARWLGNVGEAQSILAAPLPTAIGYGGLLFAGIAAGGWRAWATRSNGWLVLLSFQLGAFELAFYELRGVYAGVVLSAPALAVAIGIARTRGSLALVGAWLGSAGMLYPIAAEALTERRVAPPGAGAGCTDPATLGRLRALPAGTLMAPIDLGAYALAETRHRVIAAPYHRNNAGNAAMYRFFDADPEAARAIARAWHVDYVVTCDPMPTGGLADRLRGAAPPAWLTPVAPGVWRTR